MPTAVLRRPLRQADERTRGERGQGRASEGATEVIRPADARMSGQSGARSRTPLGLVVVVLAVAGWVTASTASVEQPRASRASAIAVADGFVSETHPSRAFGLAPSLHVDGAHVAYVAFVVPRLTGPVGRALLRVFVTSGRGRIKVVRAAKRPWSERTLTLRSAPARGATGPLSRPVRRGAWASVDVTPLVPAGGRVTLALTAVGDAAVRVASRESSGRRPTLALTAGPAQPALPVLAAFYYPWYPAAWKQRGLEPFTRYTPTLGFYDSGSRAVIRQHVEAMRYAGIQVGIASWWGPGTRTDHRLPALLGVTDSSRSAFRWAVYYEREGQEDPSPAAIRSDLAYVARRYARRPSYFRIEGRFVVFVYAGEQDACGMVDRWRQAAVAGAYIVLKVFPGYRACGSQPDGWHQYAPARALDVRPGSYAVVSPGFDKADEPSARLPRDLRRWRRDVQALKASRAPFQLVTTFNEWGEGTAVESAHEWSSASGYGAFLDVLRGGAAASGVLPAPVDGPRDVTVAAAGDIACDPGSSSFRGGQGTSKSCHQLQTANLLAGMKLDAVLTLGDTQYEDNAYEKYLQSFEPSWGRLKALIRPAIGNHEYLTAGAAGYFQYFGRAAGEPDKGYYSYDLGAWHLIALNSECRYAGGCGPGSPQRAWLLADLARHRNRCTLAYWHEPRFSSGQHGGNQQLATVWNDLVAAGVDVVLSGHNHVYERFDPLGAAPAGSDKYQSPIPDPDGMRAFVVGTGGKNHTSFTVPPLAGEVVRDDETYGVLVLRLHADSYEWLFVPEPGATFTDSGSAACH